MFAGVKSVWPEFTRDDTHRSLIGENSRFHDEPDKIAAAIVGPGGGRDGDDKELIPCLVPDDAGVDKTNRSAVFAASLAPAAPPTSRDAPASASAASLKARKTMMKAEMYY